MAKWFFAGPLCSFQALSLSLPLSLSHSSLSLLSWSAILLHTPVRVNGAPRPRCIVIISAEAGTLLRRWTIIGPYLVQTSESRSCLKRPHVYLELGKQRACRSQGVICDSCWKLGVDGRSEVRARGAESCCGAAWIPFFSGNFLALLFGA